MKKNVSTKIRNLVKANYNEIAADFDMSRKKYLWPEMERLSQELKEGDKILDAGCGNGRLIESFVNKKIEYLGFDNSSELISLARKTYPDNNFLELDLFDLEKIPDNYFDYIFLIAVIIHVPGHKNRVKVLKELASKLKPGGKIIISAWDLKSLEKYKKIIFQAELRRLFTFNGLEKGDLIFPWKDGRGGNFSSDRYYHVFTEKELLLLGQKSGLKVEKIYQPDRNFWLILRK